MWLSSTSIFLFLYFCSSIFSAAAGDLRFTLEAEKLVRDLNLFPELNLNIAAAANSSSLDLSGKIIEKRLRFPNLVADDDDDVSVEDFGHYAGYYPIQNSHAARFLSHFHVNFFIHLQHNLLN